MQALRKADVINHEVRARSLRLKFESHDGVCAFGPRYDPPCLNDPFVRDEFQIPTDDMTFKKGERAADFTIDFGRSARELAELWAI
jgi:hypothetical protein